MKEPLILTIDFGTQSVRSALFNKKGEIVSLVKKQYEPAYFSTKPGYAEQNPDYYYDCLCYTTSELIKQNKDKVDDILGVTMCFFRDSIVVCDKDNKPLRPMILWLDERRAEGKFKLPLSSRAIFKLVGMSPTIDLNMKRSMGQWIRENEPDIYKKADKFMFISTYINLRLIGEYVDSISTQAGHLPIDFRKGEWYKKDNHLKGQIFGVPVKTLCKIVKSNQVMGTVSEKASKETGLPKGMKIFSSGSDKSSETLGLAVIDNKMAAISYGTASSVEVTVDKYQSAEPFLPAYPGVVDGTYNLDVQVYRGYWMLNWFASEFYNNPNKKDEDLSEYIKTLDKEMLEINPGCDGLVLQPYWGAGLRRPLAKGSIIGFSDYHTHAHVYRAIVEGIAFCLREGLELFEKKRIHQKVEKLRIAGGGACSDPICQITADVFGIPVSRIQTNECSSLGCAISGFISAGEFANEKEATLAMTHEKDVFYPNMENHAKYDFLYKNVYLKMYPRLKNVYRNLKEYDKLEVRK